jgi:hypothetical protein
MAHAMSELRHSSHIASHSPSVSVAVLPPLLSPLVIINTDFLIGDNVEFPWELKSFSNIPTVFSNLTPKSTKIQFAQ